MATVNGSVLDPGARSVTAPVSQLGVFGLLAPGPVGSIAVVPDTVIVVIGTTQAFRADLRDGAGAVLTNRPIAWASIDTTVYVTFLCPCAPPAQPGSPRAGAGACACAP